MSKVKAEVITYQEPPPRTPQDVRAQVNLIQEVMREVMHDNEHYGVVPGTGSKPTLLKAGAEKLCLTFRLAPDYLTEKERDGDHLTITATCTLTHIPSGQRYGSGMGSCSTKESKYAYRQAVRKCPVCGKEAIIKGKAEYGGGWLCFKKKDGCGAKFADGCQEVESQAVGRTTNPDIPDTYNTVLKMACKRALVAAVLNVTAASDIFTQDIEDAPQPTYEPPAPEPAAPAAAQPAQPAANGHAKLQAAFAADMAKAETLLVEEQLGEAGELELAVLAESGSSSLSALKTPDEIKAARNVLVAFLRGRLTVQVDRHIKRLDILSWKDAADMVQMPETFTQGKATNAELLKLLRGLRECEAQPEAVGA